MSKRPSKPGNNPGFMPPRPGFAARPTVGLPPSAYGAGATVQVPGLGQGAGFRMKPPVPSQAEILAALQAAAGHYSARRFREASQILEKILSLQPNNPDALHLTGLLAQDTGKLAQAEELIALAVKAARVPSPNMLVNLGNAQREQGKLDECMAAYDKALAIDPTYVDAYINRGTAWRYKEDYKAAVADFEKAVELRPDLPAPYLRAAHGLTEIGLYREALSYCDKALERLPTPPSSIYSLMADLYERLTELDEAVACADRALAIDPNDGEAVRLRARAMRRLHPKDRSVLVDARNRLAAVDLTNRPFEHKRGLEQELAETCDRLDDVDAAFHHYGRMNDFAAEEADIIGVDRKAYFQQVERLLEFATPEKIASWTALPALGVEAGHRGPPVFLVGFPRSGTTLLDQICDAHPDIQVLEEKILIRKSVDAAGKLEGGYPASLSSLTELQRQNLRSVYWQALASEGGDVASKFVIDKMPLSLIHSGLIARAFPEAKIILALRHPADCVLSCFMQNFRLNGSMVNFLTLEGAARLYDRVMTLWQQYRALLPLNVVEVRYENLIHDLRGEVEPVLDFLGLPWNEAQADPAAHALARGTIRTPSYAQVTQPIYSSAADRWRRYQKHLEPVLPILEKHIKYFGYTL